MDNKMQKYFVTIALTFQGHAFDVKSEFYGENSKSWVCPISYGK